MGQLTWSEEKRALARQFADAGETLNDRQLDRVLAMLREGDDDALGWRIMGASAIALSAADALDHVTRDFGPLCEHVLHRVRPAGGFQINEVERILEVFEAWLQRALGAGHRPDWEGDAAMSADDLRAEIRAIEV